ncbi:ABC transporter ATP-binding protein [Geodermatophilus sp. DF01-2]|uniref:ABC transporter ATP-binding protein n=1 Tax=Geodermatophilus sp. DF01-2 TaxID=2559610 RepID=UPI0010733C97|nr:ABC transporter ATP-binding protein [Geodermatophilus sp. DF01_2]TFV59840.1 ABC transporter ATP-binding protein [Geodermatophilus sp. DF01_2]
MSAVLEVRGVGKTFGGVTALADVDLTVSTAEITALVGPNGAGKTTLFNVISGFGAPYTGEIVFDGVRLTGRKAHEIARLGLVRTFQTPVGFPSLTVHDNLVVAAGGHGFDGPQDALLRPRADRRGLRAAAERADQLLGEAGIEHLASAYMAGLSPGDLKLLEIVRQLASRPRMLLLDEPAAAMDVNQIGTLSRLIRGIAAQDVGILVIDHNLAFVLELADRVHVLDAGRLLAGGTPEEISRNADVRRVYLGEEAA